MLWRGRKIAGAAQRRTRDGLLIQGSIQPPPLSLNRADLEKALCDAACSGNGRQWLQLKPDPALLEHVDRLVREKYSQAAYNRRR